MDAWFASNRTQRREDSRPSHRQSSDLTEINGAPERIRTSDPQIRSLVLYPAELRARPVVEGGLYMRLDPRARADRMEPDSTLSGRICRVFRDFCRHPRQLPWTGGITFAPEAVTCTASDAASVAGSMG